MTEIAALGRATLNRTELTESVLQATASPLYLAFPEYRRYK